MATTLLHRPWALVALIVWFLIPGGARAEPLAQAMAEAGVQACRPISDKVNQYLTGGPNPQGLFFGSPLNADVRISSTSMVLNGLAGLSYASATFAPYAGMMGCGVVFESVTYRPEQCDAIRQSMALPVVKGHGLGEAVLVLDGGQGMKMLLMPAGSGCLQVKKEVLH